MKRLLILLLASLPLAAAEPTLSDQLRDALYTEEVTRDPAKAAITYEKILADFDQQRPLAATALFRLAEIRRNAGEKDQAIALYQRLLQEFPDREAESKLALQHLAELGGKPPAPTGPEENELEKEIRKYREMAKNSPDIFHGSDGRPSALQSAIASGNIKLIEAVIELGADPFGYGVLTLAVRSGLFEVSKLLLEKGGMPNEAVSAEALENACRDSQLKFLALLLDHGLDANSRIPTEQNKFTLPIQIAIENESLKAATLLVEHGAEVNRTCDVTIIDKWKVSSTLARAASRDDLDGVRFLLKHGADANAKAQDGDLTPLLFAAASGQTEPSLEIMKALLASGADPNHRAAKDPNADSGQKDYFDGKTALDIARELGNFGKVKLLLEAGAKVTLADLESTLSDKELNLFGLYLKYLPDFEPGDPSASFLLMEAAEKGKDILPLIERGARPSKEWQERHFVGASEEGLQTLNETFLYPDLAEKDQAWLVQPKWWNHQQIITELTQEPSSSMPSFSKTLLKADLQFDFFNDKDLEVKWTLWRKQESGELKPTELDLASNAELPEIKRGDVIEARTLGRPVAQNGAPSRQGRRSATSINWHLLRRVSFPIKVTRGEDTSEITLRGDCLSYNPTQPVAPILSAGYLSRLLFPAEHYLPLSKPLQVIVHREGWDPIRLSYQTKEWQSFPLQANDRIAIEAPLQDDAEQLLARTKQIRLVVPDTHFSSYQTVNHSPVLLPTLSELITTTYAAWNSYKPARLSDFSKDPQLRFGEIAQLIKSDPSTVPLVLPHPDLAGIRIRRLQEDGSEKIITARLAESIASFTEQSTYEQLAEAEIRLQSGDIVELPLKESSEPWTGFSEAESRYFHRLLSGAFQITEDGEVSRKTINWQPAEMLECPTGPIPFQPETGNSSNSAFALGVFYSNLDLHRGDENYSSVNSRDFFIRDGDQLAPGSDQRTPRPKIVPPAAPRTPSPRVVPPPSR